VAPTPAPLADPDTLVQLLALLGRSVTAEPDAPPELTALHLTRTLVAEAEQQAVAAEHAAAKAHGGHLPDGHDVTDHQGTYDLATAKAALTMLVVTYWRSQRLHAGVQALAHAFTGATACDGDDTEELGEDSASTIAKATPKRLANRPEQYREGRALGFRWNPCFLVRLLGPVGRTAPDHWTRVGWLDPSWTPRRRRPGADRSGRVRAPTGRCSRLRVSPCDSVGPPPRTAGGGRISRQCSRLAQ
jgi:hypothetical protein